MAIATVADRPKFRCTRAVMLDFNSRKLSESIVHASRTLNSFLLYQRLAQWRAGLLPAAWLHQRHPGWDWLRRIAAARPASPTALQRTATRLRDNTARQAHKTNASD